MTIANGLAERELAAFRAIAAERPAAGRVGEPARVGFLGRLAPEKGTKELVEIARGLAASGSGATLDIAGDGPDRDWLVAAIADVAGDDRIRWRGTVADAADLLRDVDILVVPSHNEGMPYVVLEAMAAGCAVVAFAVGGIPEIIGSGDLGVLVDPGDVAAMAGEVTALAGDPGRVAEIGRAGSAARREALRARRPSAAALGGVRDRRAAEHGWVRRPPPGSRQMTRVVVVDLLWNSPFYSGAGRSAARRRRRGGAREPALLPRARRLRRVSARPVDRDLVVHVNRPRPLRLVVRAAEIALNAGRLITRILRRRYDVVHVQWVPLDTRSTLLMRGPPGGLRPLGHPPRPDGPRRAAA